MYTEMARPLNKEIKHLENQKHCRPVWQEHCWAYKSIVLFIDFPTEKQEIITLKEAEDQTSFIKLEISYNCWLFQAIVNK